MIGAVMVIETLLVLDSAEVQAVSALRAVLLLDARLRRSLIRALFSAIELATPSSCRALC